MSRLAVFAGALMCVAVSIAAEGGEPGSDNQQQTAPNPPPHQGQFYFGPVTVTVMPSGLVAAQKELAFWESIKVSRDPEDFEDFLKRFPDSEFASLARRRLRALKSASAPAVPPSAGAEAEWTIGDRRELQRALRALGHFQGEPDGGFGSGTRAAIAQFREFDGLDESGAMTAAERAIVLNMAQRLAVLLDQPPNSPEGLAATSIRSAAQRYARAWSLDKGRGTNANPAEAAYWYALAAADGEAKAFTNLGTLVARGWDEAKPAPAAAAVLWWAAAARGEPTAMLNLGALYERGIGVAPDPVRARAWYQRAAERNLAAARAALKRLGA
jgi:peptidoglycan hydrolase-like protein with peptidoglycan-binding domain